MRKMSYVFAFAAVLAVASVATAGTIGIAFVATCVGGSPPGTTPAFNVVLGNPTLYLAPTDQTATLAGRAAFQPVPPGGLGYDKGSLYAMMDVDCRGDGLGNEIVSSIGMNIHKVGSGPDATALSATNYSVFTSGTGAGNGPWSPPSPNIPLYNQAGNLLVQNSRAVAVPGSTTDALWNGYAPNTGTPTACQHAGTKFNVGGVNGHYLVGRLDLSSATTGNTQGHLPTSFNIFGQIGTLKVTRVYDPTATNGGAPENVSFGVTGGEATVNGSSPGAESTNADAVVVIRRKGDFGSVDANGNPQQTPDGQVGSVDIQYFLQAINATDDLRKFLGDFASVDGNGNPQSVRDCQVGSVDIQYFLAAINS